MITDERDILRSYGIRTATDLLDVYSAHTEDAKSLLPPINGNAASRVASLVVALKSERNLQHVEAWKRFTVDESADVPC